MLRKFREARIREDEGFTLIELLVVVIIIGILAAIAIPVFLNQRAKARNAAANSDLRNLITAQEAYYTDVDEYADGADTAAVSTALGDDGFTSSTSVLACTSGDTSTFVAATTHTDGTLWFAYDSADGQILKFNETDWAGQVANYCDPA